MVRVEKQQDLKFHHGRTIIEEVWPHRRVTEGITLTVVSEKGRILPVCLEGRAPTSLEQRAFESTVKKALELPGASRNRIGNPIFYLLRRLGVGDGYFSGIRTVDDHSEYGFRYWSLPVTIEQFRQTFKKTLQSLR